MKYSRFADKEELKKCKIRQTKIDKFKEIIIYKLAFRELKYFYKASYFMRYLIKFHTLKNKNKSPKKNTPTLNTISTTNTTSQSNNLSTLSILSQSLLFAAKEKEREREYKN